MPPPRCRSAVSGYAIEANDQPTKPTAALPPARAGAREELLSRPHRAGGLRLVAKRPVGLAAPRPKRQHLAVGVHGAPTQVLVDDPGALAALGYRGHDQRLADPRVAARVDVADGGAVRLVGTDVAAAVEVQPELRHEAVVLGVLESDRDQRQVGLEHELAPGHRREVARGGASDLARVDVADPAVLAPKAGHLGAPSPCPALLERVGGRRP